ncbi:Predicted RNA binding protein, contains G-patch and Zn-finger domains [Ceraceosorus bombacis]|uniref:Predicted RNA binding protein, contains G-patch and Zn-finger domains n=1 Tax=Ceraceosorus bombacis TaxID=401625 RepID=A0A0P1BB94_9BASI|nr:Predicted RNA binding protein, contains G-patch and Zn-finger domains [Ceraceosorus bombacis]
MATDASSTRLTSSPQQDHEEEEEEEEEEEDYMSLAFVSQPVTSSGNSACPQPLLRTKPKGSSSTAGTRQRELLARQKGLDRSLFAPQSGNQLQHEGDEGSAKRESKAVRMMKGMGWSEGKSLGLVASSGSARAREQHMARGEATASRRSASPQPREATIRGPSKDKGQCGEAQRSELSASHPDALFEPIRPDERWAGGCKGGIGSLSVLQSVQRISQAIKRAAEGNDVQGTSSQDFEASLKGYRDRVGGKVQALRLEKLMESARKTTEELDGRVNVEYSPLWLDPRWLWMPDAAPSEAGSVMEQAFGKAEGMEGDEGDGWDEQATCVHQERLREAQRWAKLDTPARLQITLDHLRRAHNYCLFCGCAYDDFDQLQKLCPGLTEEDHD